MTPTIQQKFAIDQELHNAVRLLRAGLGQLQAQDDHASDFLHLPILTLASGLERLMKVTLCFGVLGAEGHFPNADYLLSKRNGHDLSALLDRVCDKCFSSEYLERIPVAVVDMNFLKCEFVSSLIALLRDFGQSDRYYFLDVVVGRAGGGAKDPEQSWKALRNHLMGSEHSLELAMHDVQSFDLFLRQITARIVATFERIVRAIARLFTIGGIGSDAKASAACYLYDFLCLRDEQLGQTKYSIVGGAMTTGEGR